MCCAGRPCGDTGRDAADVMAATMSDVCTFILVGFNAHNIQSGGVQCVAVM